MTIRATHAPAGASGKRMGPPAVRYDTAAPWPGITTGRMECYLCTWAVRDGVYQVKYLNAACFAPGHRGVSGG